MLLLGIESSCDETAAAVVCDGVEVLSNIVRSQADIHARYGGVVPEIASRAHTEAVAILTKAALSAAGVTMREIDGVAVTYAPGLIGALLIGVNFGKSLAYRYEKPLVPVHHIKGHIAAAYLGNKDLAPPFLAFVASGGHTSIIEVKSHTSFLQLGQTRDDAAGEAFDKIARTLDIPYPGGAQLEKLACMGDHTAFAIPNAKVSGRELDFSFSGIKTHVINQINTHRQKYGALSETVKADISASVTYNITNSITSKVKSALALTGHKTLVAAGGVMANNFIRRSLASLCNAENIRFICPEMKYCGDNAAMIASQGFFEYISGVRAGNELNAKATERVADIYL